MTARSFLILVAVTVAAVAWAAVTVAERERADVVVGSGERMFPGLPALVEHLATIVVRGGDGAAVTIRRRGSQWTVDERGGYPADGAKVRALILGMADLEMVEAKTDQPARYARIGVEGVDGARAGAEGDTKAGGGAPGAASREVILIDDDGEAIARLIVGGVAAGLGGETGRYVRPSGSARAWLVRGDIDPAPDPRQWLAPTIADVSAALVQRIVVRHPDGQTITATRDSPEDASFRVAELPRSARLRHPENADGLAGVLEGLTLEDVRPIDQIKFPPSGTILVTVSTFDGMVVSLELTEADGDTWARVLAGTTHTQDADATNALDAVRSLNARTTGWAYRLPERTARLLQRPLDALIADKPPRT
jgi:Domain of unknown function (DUF4340)